MDDVQQPVDPKRVKSFSRKLARLRTSLDRVTTEAQEVLAELSSQSEALQEENQQLSQDLEHEREARQELAERLETTEGKIQRLEAENQRLAQDLEDEGEEKKKLAERLETAESENQHLDDERGRLAEELESARKQTQALTERLQSVEGEKQDLERKNDQLGASLQKLRDRHRSQERANKRLRKRIDTIEGEHETLKRELDTCRSDKEVLVLEINQVEEKAKREKLECGLRFARELSPLLVDLSDLSGLEPEAVKGLKPRSVLEKLRAWVEQVTEENPVPFPSKGEMLADHMLCLDPDEAGIEALIEMYDWRPDHPFEGLPVGERSRHFRLLRRGWRIGDDVLVRAQVVVEDGDQEEEEEDKRSEE
jgi:chromosome segregation ATPase